MRYVIIGNGVAGVYAAEAIRQLDANGDITMIGDEIFPPYCRPMISHLLEGSVMPDKLSIRSKGFYDDLKITTVLGNRVTDIDTDNKAVFIKEKKFYFDKLLIATGADPRPVKAGGLNLDNIFFMRTQNHVRQMINELPDVKNALVIGGGLVGFKAAYSLLHRGIDVTMLIRSEYPLSMQVDEKAGMMILDELVRHGLKVKTGVESTDFEGKKKVKRAYLSDGTNVSCDMVIIGKGVIPALSFIPRDKIKTDSGIMVNSYMETNISGIFAAGDVAETYDIVRKNPRVNAIFPEAVSQGRIAGINMAGKKMAYKGSLGRNVIRIFDMDVMSGGIVNPPVNDSSYQIITDFNPRLKTYRKLVFRENKLVGMILVNKIEQGGILLSLIQSEMPVTISRAALLNSGYFSLNAGHALLNA